MAGDKNFLTEEQFLIGRLKELHAAYQKDAEPYIQALLKIRMLQPPQPIIVSGDLFRGRPDGYQPDDFLGG